MTGVYLICSDTILDMCTHDRQQPTSSPFAANIAAAAFFVIAA